MISSQPNTVAVKRCADYRPVSVLKAISEQFDLLGGIERFVQPGKRILIKPNLIIPKSPLIPAQTHPEVIYAIAQLVKAAGAIPLVGDSPAWSTTENCLKVLGVYDRLIALGAQIVNLNRPVRMNIEGTPLGISRIAMDADAIINVPKLKAHQQLVATFAFKNMYGCVCGLGGKEKAYWHFARGKTFDPFCRMIVGIYQKIPPVLNIIDGIVAMEGQGPINGDPRNVGYLIAGINPVACERICCDLVGFNPKELPLLMTAVNMDVGSLDAPVEILGDTFVGPVCPDFKAAQLTPLRFTFPRICKSIAKQGVILVKGLFSGK